MIEIWKDIKGFEGKYQVSNFGMVKSLGRYIKGKSGSSQFKKETILKPTSPKNRYPLISLTHDYTKSVHRLVAIAFIPNPYNKPQVNHKNGIKSDNRLENLEWVTASENGNHSYKNGLSVSPNGEKHYLAKLTEQNIKEIRHLLKSKSQNEIAKKFNVHQVTISFIKLGKSWKHVK